jgi:hypothetical protein
MDSRTQKYANDTCTICLMKMNDGDEIKRIPTCMHSFHPHCLRKWFEEKISEDNQKCPQCNQELKTFKMKEAKQKNRDAMMIEPKLRGSNPSGAKIGTTNEMSDMTGNQLVEEPMDDSSESGYSPYTAAKGNTDKKYKS